MSETNIKAMLETTYEDRLKEIFKLSSLIKIKIEFIKSSNQYKKCSDDESRLKSVSRLIESLYNADLQHLSRLDKKLNKTNDTNNPCFLFTLDLNIGNFQVYIKYLDLVIYEFLDLEPNSNN